MREANYVLEELAPRSGFLVSAAHYGLDPIGLKQYRQRAVAGFKPGGYDIDFQCRDARPAAL